VVLCLEVGVFLLVAPWLEKTWDRNLLAWLAPESLWWRSFFLNPYVRGAVSGLGLLNIYIALLEVFRLRRFALNSNHPLE